MKRKVKWISKKAAWTKIRLRLPDLDQAKAAVLNSLHSPESQRGYQYSINEFIAWYCSEPRLSFNKTVVTRYRMYLESRQLAPGTINVRLASARRLAYEAADSGLLSPELAVGIRRVKGAKRLGVRLGNWLTAEEAHLLWQLPNTNGRFLFQIGSNRLLMIGCAQLVSRMESYFDAFVDRELSGAMVWQKR